MGRRHARVTGIAAIAFFLFVFANAARAAGEDLTSLSLEQLMNEPVTSVSKKETRLGEAPAAITVVTLSLIHI